MYKKDLLRAHSLNAKVISVGNLVLGGTGKSPVVIEICQILLDAGMRPAILSRGHGRSSSDDIVIVSDGKKILTTSDISGDEPQMMAQSLRGVPVLVGKDRFQMGLQAINQYKANVLVLDDGFQHLRLRRDLDILLVDSKAPWGPQGIFPAGTMRESKVAIRRAEMILLTRFLEDGGVLESEIKSIHPEARILKVKFDLGDELTCLDGGSAISVKSFMEKYSRVAAFCGVGQPDAFFSMLEKNGFPVVLKKKYPDHHAYSEQTVKEICAESKHLDAQALLTTAKDAVKLFKNQFDRPVFIIELKIHFLEAEEQFKSLILGSLDSARDISSGTRNTEQG